MISTEDGILAVLDAHQIGYRRYAHAPVYTCAEAEQVWPEFSGVGGASVKNLFLQAGERSFLAVTSCEQRLNMRALGRALGLRERLTFGSPDALAGMLGVSPGSVTTLALINDPQGLVEVVFDQSIWESAAFLFHPLVNTATLVMARAEVLRFLELTQHSPLVLPF